MKNIFFFLKKRWVDILFGGSIFYFSVLLLQLFCFASFKIPSDSMEPVLTEGDYILVNKMIPGARIFDLLTSVKGGQVNINRMPGWRTLKRNDIVVFNIPYPDQTDTTLHMDYFKYYVKRCIALPGDTFFVHKGIYGVKGISEKLGNEREQRRFPSVRAEYPYWLYEGINGWDVTEFGPFYLPRRGSTVILDNKNIALYRRLIMFETGYPVKQENGIFKLNGEILSQYTFQKNYYFMAGDNVANSQDSRYWGALPEEYIVGKAWIVWKSVEPNNKIFRWERFLKKIE
ncbi:MAG: signal peptidase I [Bacteroidales bacterium]|nr:signal peptidase I [Bacteroidales bacterium]